MKSMSSFFLFSKKHFLPITIGILTILLVCSSYVRFVVLQDYLVAYEGDCDPYTESCFEECEDGECTETYFYSIIERHAAEIHTLCGADISECDEAYECQEGVENCSITYCEPETDGEETCISLTEEES